MTVERPWVFLGADRSHFSAKLRPALRYKQLHHVEYPPDPEEVRKRTGLGFIPVLISPADETLQDTTDIIDALEQRFPEPRLLPPDPVDLSVCRLLELYADEFFPIVSMRTRWAYPENAAELRRAFGAFAGSVEFGNRIADRMSGYLPVLGITPETLPAIDAHTDDMLAALCAHFREHRFLLGDRLSLADCALMGPLYAHLYLDRVTRKKLYDDAIEVCMWIERCNRPVPERMGQWFQGAYPDSLAHVLRLVGEDAAPMLAALGQAFDGWAAANAESGMALPRGVGEYQSELRGVTVTAAVRSYVPWKIQRLRDTAAGADHARVAAALRSWSCGLLVDKAVSTRLVKRAFELTVA